MEGAVKFLNDNPVLWGVAVWAVTIATNEVLAALSRKYPDNSTVAWITERAHAYLGTLPKRIDELQRRKDEVVR